MRFVPVIVVTAVDLITRMTLLHLDGRVENVVLLPQNLGDVLQSLARVIGPDMRRHR